LYRRQRVPANARLRLEQAGAAAIKTTTPRGPRGAAARCTAAWCRAPRPLTFYWVSRTAAARLLSSDWQRRASTGGCLGFF